MNEKTITKRIREVWPADQVAHLWANRSQDHARTPGAANFYFHGPVIFSYRDSYAIATFTPWRDADTGRALVIMRETPASMTTGRHFGRVFGALRGHPVRVIEVDPVYRGAVAEVPELARFADGFTDLARHEGRLIADGHARTGLSIAAVLIWHARKRAAELSNRPGRMWGVAITRVKPREASPRKMARPASRSLAPSSTPGIQ